MSKIVIENVCNETIEQILIDAEQYPHMLNNLFDIEEKAVLKFLSLTELIKIQETIDSILD